MQTKREYAASLGLAKAGARGRFSAEAKAAIAKAEESGIVFSDSDSVSTVKTDSPKRNSDSSSKPDSVKPPKDSVKDAEYLFGSTPAKRFDGGWAYDENGKLIDMSGNEVCRTCGYSLDFHICNTPIGISKRGELVEAVRR